MDKFELKWRFDILNRFNVYFIEMEKNTINKVKSQTTEWEEIFTMNATDKGWVPDYIRNSNKSVRKRPTTKEKNLHRI